MNYSGFDIRRFPSTKPRPERETFSGGHNDSARERNRAALAKARTMYFMKAERMILVPSWCFDELMAQLRAAVPDVPAAIPGRGGK